MSVGHVYIDSTVTFAPEQISSRNFLLLCPILISSSGQITLISDDFFLGHLCIMFHDYIGFSFYVDTSVMSFNING